jgi:hypothetical protein
VASNADFHVGSSAATWASFHLPSLGMIHIGTCGNSRRQGNSAIVVVAVD